MSEIKHAGKDIKALSHNIARTLDYSLENEMTRTQGRVLHFIIEEGKDRDIFQKDVEAFFSLRGSSTTELLQKLEHLGMIERKSSNVDKRLKKIVVTNKGIKQDQVVFEKIDTFEKELRSNISDSDMDIFYKVIDQMMINCQRIQEKKEDVK